eukprot:5649202-Pyramimonas_sp.AAC.1
MVLRIVAQNVEWADYTRLEELSTFTPTTDILLLNEEMVQTTLPNHTAVQLHAQGHLAADAVPTQVAGHSRPHCHGKVPPALWA